METIEILFPQGPARKKNPENGWFDTAFITVQSKRKGEYFPSYPNLKMSKQNCSRYVPRKDNANCLILKRILNV